MTRRFHQPPPVDPPHVPSDDDLLKTQANGELGNFELPAPRARVALLLRPHSRNERFVVLEHHQEWELWLLVNNQLRTRAPISRVAAEALLRSLSAPMV